jgi:alcohol dehydrogenase (cytochrome c)
MKVLTAILSSMVMAGAAAAQVPFERIRHAEKEPGSWLTYSGNLLGQRYSPLKELTPATVAKLKVRWAFQFPDRGNETSSLVADGVMYVTWANGASALDLHTGRALWTWKRPLPTDYHSVGFGHVSRGPAILDDNLYVATLDGYLVALDLKSGIERWSSQVADYKLGYSITVAPLALDGKVLVGVSGGEAGIRGLLDAHDAKLVSEPGDSGRFRRRAKLGGTWAGDSLKTGGGPTW